MPNSQSGKAHARQELAEESVEQNPPGMVDQAPILVVDDDSANRLAISAILEGLGQPVVSVGSGEQALRELLSRDYAVILLDVIMPGMDGYEAASLIRGRDRCRHVPIIFLSAVNKDQAHLFRGYSAGAVDYVFKPVEPLILRSKVSVFIELHNKAQEIRRQTEQERRLLAENLHARTEQMRMEQALQRSRAQQSLIIDSLPLALYAAEFSDAKVHARAFVGANPETLSGYSSRSFSDTPELWIERIHQEDRGRVLKELARVEETGFFEAEYRWQCADGTYRWFLDRGVLAQNSESPPREMFGFWLDVTERRLLQQQLAHAQKMESLGQITGGVAHDFNNMLTVIIGSLERVRLAEGDSRNARRIELALQGALSCADLTKRLLGFARRQSLQPRVLDPREQIRRLAEILQRSMGQTIRVEMQLASDLWPVFADPAQLEATLLNIAINARDAMPDGGCFRITARNEFLDQHQATALGIAADDYISLELSDTGMGMENEILQRALEPFFTTKPDGKGTGLGLSTTYGFIKQSNGALSLDSKPGAGTRVRLFLPRCRVHSAAASLQAGGSPEAASLAGYKVLVVEDDAKVREVAVTILKDLGCTVLEAESAAQALRCLEEQEDIALLFTDWVLPGGTDGGQLAKEAVAKRSALRVLFCSAYRRGGPVNFDVPAGSCFLAKPYRAGELADTVRNLLRGEMAIA